MIKKMGGKIDFDERDDTFFFEDDEMDESDVIATNNRHSWHASNKSVLQVVYLGPRGIPDS